MSAPVAPRKLPSHSAFFTVTSCRILHNPGGYLSGLTLFRLGQVDPWVRWFADMVAGGGETPIALVREVNALQTDWAARLEGLRGDAAASRAIELLPRHPVLAASTVAGALDMSERTAMAADPTLSRTVHHFGNVHHSGEIPPE